MNSAQVTLVKGDLLGILRARSLSVATVKNMHQNLAFCLSLQRYGYPPRCRLVLPANGTLVVTNDCGAGHECEFGLCGVQRIKAA
jgi:Cu+-exporting ATPase